MSYFQDLGVFVHNNSETEAQMRFAALNDKAEREHTARYSFGLLPQDYYERKTPKS